MPSHYSAPRQTSHIEGQRTSPMVSVVIEEGVVKSCVEGVVIPDVNFESFFGKVWHEHGDMTAVVDTLTETKYTFGELLDASRRVACGLRRLGLGTGDVVAFHGPNSCELLVAMCGTFFAGGTAMFTKSSLNREEIHYQLADGKPKFIFCELEYMEVMKEISENLSSVEALVVINGASQEAHSLSDLKKTVLFEKEAFLGPSPHMTLCIVYSSGTTGLPKGVELTHRNLIAQAISYGCLEHVYAKGDSMLCLASIMHIGAFWAVFCYLGLGSKVILLHKFHVATALSAIDLHKPTTLGAYPAIVKELDAWPQHEDFHGTSVKKIVVGGGAVNPPVIMSMMRKLSLKELVKVYGMTELTCCISCSRQADDLKSVGKPAPFIEMKVVDFYTREALGPNQQGEICVKSPAAFKGYLNRPNATADAYEDGFVRTGDKGYYTADGCFFLCGRFKELIKCMDQQVYPAELEELLAADPEVQHVVVAAVPHPQYGEAARAFVVHQRRLRDPLEERREAERLKQLVADRLAFHKQLHGDVEFLDDIPKSEIGKDLRGALAKTYIERCKESGKREVN